ncbi:MAG: hypothetical protein QOE44_2161 [Solirubrobacteraceae bacterium]|jgi:DNA-binding response OmpR family regulator|nr:hypothetical protein [Solirubrobacteraceae bacterium]
MTERSSASEGVAGFGSTAPPPGLRIAILDRDSGFLAVLGKRLERAGWEQRILASTASPESLAPLRLNAVVVDLAVLGPHGWDWLARLCQALPDLGVVVCTGSSTVAQRVRGLRLGADDWLAKPCHPEELIARLEAVVRRRRRMEAPRHHQPIQAGEVEIRRDRYQAFVAGHGLDLTRREFELIELLATSDGRVLEREFIYRRLWGYSMVRGDRSVDVFVRKVRQKLERASPGWRYIHTHFGIGYRFAAEPADPREAAGGASGPAPAVGEPARLADAGQKLELARA